MLLAVANLAEWASDNRWHADLPGMQTKTKRAECAPWPCYRAEAPCRAIQALACELGTASQSLPILPSLEAISARTGPSEKLSARMVQDRDEAGGRRCQDMPTNVIRRTQ